MKNSEILKEVREYLSATNTRYICWAIRDLDLGTFIQQGNLINWIWKMVTTEQHRGVYTLELWVKYNRPSFIISPESMKELRLKWLDWMINECEKEELK